MINLHSNVPKRLREHDQWLLWRYEERYGRVTKVPYQRNGRRGSSTDPSTWAGFEEVVADEFHRVCGFRLPPSPAEGGRPSVGRWIQQKPLFAAVIFVTFLCLIGGLVVALVSIQKIQVDRDEKTAALAQMETDARHATRQRANILRLAAFQTLEELRTQAEEELWPLQPSTLELCERWMESARAVPAERASSTRVTATASRPTSARECRVQ